MRRLSTLSGLLGLLVLAAGCAGNSASARDVGDLPLATAIPTIDLSILTPTLPPSATPIPPAGAGATTGAPGGQPVVYVVQAGDTLFSIARKYGVPIEQLAAANNIADPGTVVVGQRLVIPAAGSSPEQVQALAHPTPTPVPPPPGQVNGIPVSSFVIMPDAVKQNMRDIYRRGLALGNNPNAFSRVGDSTIEQPHFLVRFDQPGTYNLADYAYLQPVIDAYRGSFARDNISVRRGLHSWSMFDPVWADKTLCLPNEGPLPCEIRLHHPSLIIIRLGSNDTGVPAGFKASLQKIVQYCIDNGVVPILGTKADRREGPDNINNTIIRQLAADYRVPLWDFDVVAGTLPNRGIDPTDPDGVHMSFFYAHDYSRQEAFERGHGVHNLTALIMLDEVRRVLAGP